MLDTVGFSIYFALAVMLPIMWAATLTIRIAPHSLLLEIITWSLLTIAPIMAGFAFAHFAVDLPAYHYHPAQAAWLLITIAFITTARLLGGQTIYQRLSNVAGMISEKTGHAVVWFTLSMALVQAAIVFGRYVFGVNSIFLQESLTYMHGTVFLLVAGYALLTNDHVRVDIFYREAAPHAKARIDFWGWQLFLFPLCALILWSAAPYVGTAWQNLEGSTEASGIQGVFLLKTLIPLFALMMALAGFHVASKAALILQEHGR